MSSENMLDIPTGKGYIAPVFNTSQIFSEIIMKKALFGVAAMAAIILAGFLLLPNQGTLQSAVIPVSGMSCGNCADKISKTLYDLDGVESADVSFAKGAATVQFNPAVTNEAAIAGAIEKLGYQTKPVAGSSTSPKAACEPEDKANASDCCASKAKSSST
jgi:copper chaperone CopZ